MHWELMDRYLAGECSKAELVEVERWVSEVPRRRDLLDQLAITAKRITHKDR